MKESAIEPSLTANMPDRRDAGPHQSGQRQ